MEVQRARHNKLFIFSKGLLLTVLYDPYSEATPFSQKHPNSKPRSFFVNKWLIGGERVRPDPEIRQGVEILLVSAGHGIFLPALDSQAVFSRRKRPDFFYQQDVYEDRSVNANESVGFERFREDRNRLT